MGRWGGRQLGSAPRPALLCWGPGDLVGVQGQLGLAGLLFHPEDPCAPVLKGTINLGPQGQWGVGWRQISAPAAPFSGPTALGTLWVSPVRFLWEPLHSPRASATLHPPFFPLSLAQHLCLPVYSWTQPREGLGRPGQAM